MEEKQYIQKLKYFSLIILLLLAFSCKQEAEAQTQLLETIEETEMVEEESKAIEEQQELMKQEESMMEEELLTMEEKIAKIKEMFPDEEQAKVTLETSDDVTISLLALNFDPGQASIKPDDFNWNHDEDTRQVLHTLRLTGPCLRCWVHIISGAKKI